MNNLNLKIGQRIKETRKSKDLTIKELAKKVGVAESTISRYENGKIEDIKMPVIDSMANILHVNPSWIIFKSNEKEMTVQSNTYNSIPILGTIAAGTPILAEENVEDYFNIDSKIKADFALKVKGDSMIKANIHDGDIVFIKKQCEIENGEIGAVLIDDEATLKRVYKENGVLTLQAENDNYAPRVYTNGNIKILGKMVANLKIYN